MVQEFHVLRCFSCQTFQVQQVKKSKKWTCKVCGEKQSLIKEFGRGTAADCRRHVQKLNALRGQMLEVNSEQLLSQGEPDENYGSEDVNESLVQNHKSEQEVAHVSRWSKYTDQTAEGPDRQEDEEEDENVYTERYRFKSQGTRKRKKISTFKSFGGPYDNCEDEESLTGCPEFKRQPYLPLQHDRFNSSWNKGFASKYSSCGRPGDVEPCTRINLPSSYQAVCYPTACSNSTYTVENSSANSQQFNSSYKPPTLTKGLTMHTKSPSVSSRKSGESKIENKDSKWDKFLTVVPNQQDEEEYDYDAHDSSNYSDNTAVPYFTEALMNIGVDSEKCRYPPNEKTDSGAVKRQKSVGGCVDRNVSSPTNNHSSKTNGFENAVCKQPSLSKAACSSLSINSLFFTDEDFDDTF
ncbi:MRN complex-interacting protein [Labeo rohita]|uniref:MRN complex-interacting protein n=1 Tax=Labeo rohita TaxID=84645 RepID=UPI0021E30CD8|nr:MRN complex-interacting protein [Labeo rohita]